MTSVRFAEALGLGSYVCDQHAVSGGGRELLQHGALIEGVGLLGQAPGARQHVAEGALVDMLTSTS